MRDRWTHRERQSLAAFYPAISAKKLQEILPGRGEQAIRQEAHFLGLKKCHERLREQGRENVNRRWHGNPDGRVFRDPSPPPQ